MLGTILLLAVLCRECTRIAPELARAQSVPDGPMMAKRLEVADRERNPTRWFLSVAVLISGISLLAATAHAAAPHITQFTATPDIPIAGALASFSWTSSDSDGDTLTCVFDPTGVGPVVVITNCAGAQQLDHTYPSPGVYQPRITVSDASSAATADLRKEVRGNVSFSYMYAPSPGAPIGTSLIVRTAFTSEYDVLEVKARILDREANMNYSPTGYCLFLPCSGGFVATLDLAGLPTGPLTLEVRLMDVNGVQAYYYQRLMLDRPPELSVAMPLASSVARPTLNASATCNDDGPSGCTISALVLDQATLVPPGPSPLAETLNLSAYEGRTITLRFYATDSSYQSVWIDRVVHVDSSSRLVEIAALDGEILDVSRSHVLQGKNEGTNDRLFIYDRDLNTNAEIILPAALTVIRGQAFLGPLGAIFVAHLPSGSSTSSHLYEFDGVVVNDLGAVSCCSLTVKENFAIWTNGTNLYRRDLALRQTVLITNAAGDQGHSVAETGVVTYWSSDHRILRYDGGTTLIADDPILWSMYPSSDGNATIFLRRTPSCTGTPQSFSVMLATSGNPPTELDSGGLSNFCGQGYTGKYQVNFGWVAFNRPGNLGQFHVWTRSPSQQMQQRTFFGYTSLVDKVGRLGELMVLTANGRRLLSKVGLPPEFINSALGESYPWTSGWEISIGRSLFFVSGTEPTFANGFE